MQSNQHIEKMALLWSNARMLNDRCSGLFFNDMGRAALLAVIFGVVVMLATGCSSTGTGFSTRLVSPVLATQGNSDPQDDGWYQPPRSPGFNDLTGS
jgi:hypothetical protein